MRVACIGEAMVELSLEGPAADRARLGYAGDVLNTAVYLKRAAPELQVDFVTRLGRDGFSDRMRAFIAGEGVGTGAIETDPDRRPGLYAIETDAEGERSFTYWRDSSAARAMFQTGDGPDFSALEDYDVVYLSGITLAILPKPVRSAFCAWLERRQRDDGGIAFDSNYRPALWPDQETARGAAGRMWKACTIGLPSLDDEMALFGDADEAAAVDRLARYGFTGALKRGARGPVSLGAPDPDDPAYLQMPVAPAPEDFPPARQVVDTTAAGDSFNGGYLGALLTGKSQDEALRAGHAMASRVVGAKGAIIPR
ncbi:sugar kinase [Psychromarinibacter sp. C21-152]|uniref:Sugar kinase n=1 Tax=Psychromarinibacter sediminicola TaxID=3033385 RepID=A0AAE3NQD1_9RHOB|nr:sugar kinase [Psychromarinibacter sediminicola]MDF0601603.1 sugar kinase [Psychromarinibacter sediminicola]